MNQAAYFITLEGVDGAGKSTHVPWIREQLTRAGVDLVCTREPGGTPVGERLRELVLHEPMEARTEALLLFAARCEHWRTRIAPALAQGKWVLCDRYIDASYAYQGGGRQLGCAAIQVLEDWLGPIRRPDCTLLFDVPLEVARQRLSRGRTLDDRFEQEGTDFFNRTRDVYLERARRDPARVHRIDAQGTVAQTREQLHRVLAPLLRSHGGGEGSRP